MANTFDFGMNEMNVVSNSLPKLTPWTIHNVKLEKAETSEFNGKQDPSIVYKVLRVRFSNDKGYYEETIFFPKEGDNVRQKFTNAKGEEYEVASSWERTKLFIGQTANALNPEGFKKMQELSSKFKSFDDMAKAYCTIMNQVIGKETNLKLVGRQKQDGSVEPALPRFAGVSREGKLFTSDNFVGEILFFTPYEEQKRAAFMNAKPTSMPDMPFVSGNDTKEEEDETFDLNSLL